MMKNFLYRATMPNQARGSQQEDGGEWAESAAGAREQLALRGYRDIQIMNIDAKWNSLRPDISLPTGPEFNKIRVRSQFDSIGLALLRNLVSNWILWLPFTLWSAIALFQGAPYTLSDYSAFALTGVAVVVLIKLNLPRILFNRIQAALAIGQPDTGLAALRMLRRVNSYLNEETLDFEEVKLLLLKGDYVKADALLGSLKQRLPEPQFAIREYSMLMLRGDFEQAIVKCRAVQRVNPQAVEYRIDFAAMLARYGQSSQEITEAQQLIDGLDPKNMTELAGGYLYFAQALLALRTGEHQVSIARSAQAMQNLAGLALPTIANVRAEIMLNCAFAHKYLGQRALAESIWQQYLPAMEGDPHARDWLQKRWNAKGNAWS